MLKRFSVVLLFCILISSVAFTSAKEEQARRLEMLGLDEKWNDDLDGMIKRRKIRVLVTFNKMLYFLDGPTQRGASYEILKEFEKFVNKKLRTKVLKINVIFIPVGRQDLLPALVEGLGDIAAANLTITEDRQKLMDFSDPFLDNVSELLVTGPAAPKVSSIDDLSGKSVHVRPSASYFESLKRINISFQKRGLPKVIIIPADQYLEDGDLLEMVNAGLIPMVIVDSHKAEFWKEIFDNIQVHTDISINSGGQIAWALRKKSYKLNALIKEFVRDHKKGTLIGNIVYKRYLRENKWVRNSLAKIELKKFKNRIVLFKKYGGKYNFDWLMLAALGYQESGLDHRKKSHTGAIGIMQVLPKTAADPKVNIPNINNLENNIHAGTKYLRFIHDRYFSNERIDGLNQLLFALAAYNAGPARVAKLRREATRMGLNPDV